MSHALVLLGHADPKSLNAALARAYTDAFRAAGGTATLVTLSDLRFDPVLRHGHGAGQALEPDLLALRRAFESAHHVAWFFPTYWASPPAVVRGVVDRLFLPNWAFRYGSGPLPEGLMRGRSARMVTTMDSPALWYAFSHNRAIHGAFVSGTLRFVGFAPIRTRTIYGVRTLSQASRERWVGSMAELARVDCAKAPAQLLPAPAAL
ncbi:NAD(P)H-dependent oxidoreductase [Sorangium sp. So ce1078]|uniref:NAD(P)H-dependent oxidoreductase n=1 Tax=Sorangium sp. So ce1078 TaxID=3133329 RepID=UPI003F5F0303